uniref:Protein phosphatase 1E n=1 Tax=Mola mola TaxID=94237 RepID=A0A3Q4B1S8_MOLML
MDEEEARCFLGRFVEEFPAALEEDHPLPVKPLSHCISLDELHGESLQLGLKLLAARAAPGGFSALLCQAAVSQLLQNDLSPFHCPQEAEANKEEEQQQVILFDSGAVQRVFFNKLIDVALAWHQNLPELPPAPSWFLRCSVHAIKNTRRKMEDKHVVLADFNQLFGIKDGVERAYYAVFDGHGGVDAATYAATHLHVALSKQEKLKSDTASAFKTAFKQIDDMFKGKTTRERLRSGTTGVAVLIQGQELTVGWLGDSQAVLVRNGQAVTLMDPHKPDREDEKQRIEDLGGCVTFMGCWRVNGTYAVSRAIGDFDQKPYVCGDADCSITHLSGDEDYILLACDGFFDAVKPLEVPYLVLDALQQHHAVGLRVAKQLVNYAKAAGSNDNITVVLVFLRPPERLLATPDTSAGTVQPTRDFSSQDAPQQ